MTCRTTIDLTKPDIKDYAVCPYCMEKSLEKLGFSGRWKWLKEHNKKTKHHIKFWKKSLEAKQR